MDPCTEPTINWVYQIFLPLLGGGIGGLTQVIYLLFKLKGKRLGFWAAIGFIFLGSVAGFVAVNLLNPKGDFSQVMTLSILVGINGLTFLTRNSLVDGKLESEYQEAKESALDKMDHISEAIDKEYTPKEYEELVKTFDDEGEDMK
ncbi:hypothetical protein COK19_15845 [Bacillus cereus]|uniref:hypothetical protein n=1 Tax=Bacillus cereus TaxID=1396 RepID=UPI000BF2B0AC|nr:hypothetical protein [Bacillus cereus]PFR25355.1 hypothetical protein COK19_15845 [Bacillus cereus]